MSQTVVGLSVCVTVQAGPEHEPAIETFRLEQELQFVLLPRRDLPIVYAAFVWKVGSGDEGPDEQGFAHLAEHLRYDGHPDNPKQALQKSIEHWGGRSNAYTTREQTVYEAWIPRERLNDLLDMQLKGLASFAPDNARIEQEKTIIRQEDQQKREADPFESIYRDINRDIFGGNSYGHPILGADAIDKWRPAAFRRFLQKNYVNQRLTVLISGDFDRRELSTRLSTELKSTQMPSLLASEACEDFKASDQWQVHLKRSGETLYVGAGVRAPGTRDRRFLALNALLETLEKNEAFQKQAQLQELEIDFDEFSCRGALFFFFKDADESRAKETVAGLSQHIQAFVKSHAGKEEFHKTRLRLGREIREQQATREGRARLWLRYANALEDFKEFEQLTSAVENLNWEKDVSPLLSIFALKNVSNAANSAKR